MGMRKEQLKIEREQWESRQAVLTQLAFIQADVWARSEKGTAYGVVEPVLEVLTEKR